MARRDDFQPKEKDDMQRKLVAINRVTKVVKGGRNMRFAACVVVGDGKGNVGMGMGKAGEVPEAIEKAVSRAKRNLIHVSVTEAKTIPHETKGIFGKSTILMMPAPEGTGVIAGGSVRAVVELAGIKNIVTKSHGTSNPINTVKAALAGLASLRSPEQVAALRGKTVEELLG